MSFWLYTAGSLKMLLIVILPIRNTLYVWYIFIQLNALLKPSSSNEISKDTLEQPFNVDLTKFKCIELKIIQSIRLGAYNLFGDTRCGHPDESFLIFILPR